LSGCSSVWQVVPGLILVLGKTIAKQIFKEKKEAVSKSASPAADGVAVQLL
jgi:hypothetical protein